MEEYKGRDLILIGSDIISPSDSLQEIRNNNWQQRKSTWTHTLFSFFLSFSLPLSPSLSLRKSDIIY